MIYAQRPNATACADFDTWNKRMGRYVRRGSNGIALLDTTGSYPKLRYVFDVADTGAREKSRDVNLWTMEKQHIDAVAEMLVHNYGIVGNGTLSDKFEQTAIQLAAEYWQEHHRDIADIVDNSFLEEYDIDSLGMQFRSAAAVSITYSLMSRCGMNPGEHFEHEDFLAIFDFNTPDTIAALGTAVSDISEQVLRQIEVTVKNYERTHEHEERTDLHEGGRLQSPESDLAEAGESAARQIQQDTAGISEESPTDSVQSADSVGEAVLAPDRDRGDGEPADGADDGRADEGEWSERADEGIESDAVGADDEQSESAGGGNNSVRAGVQLSIFDEIPSEAEQIAYIDEAESKQDLPFAFSMTAGDVYNEELELIPAPRTEMTQDEIDDAPRYFGEDIGRKVMIAEYMLEHGREKGTAAWLAQAYHGDTDTSKQMHFTIPNTDIDVEWSWAKVQRRVAQLVQGDEFFTENERLILQQRQDAREEISSRDAEIMDIEPSENFRITDDNLGIGGAKTKFRMNMDAIHILKQIESENRHATPEEQEVLSKYVGWGGLADVFDDTKENWRNEYSELLSALTLEEYTAARSSTLNAHYTSPTVIKAIFEAVGNMGFTTGNVLEPSMGVGNFFGLLPQEMSGFKLYGVELDSITGRIAKQLYPNADITVAGFETTDRRDFFDLAVDNVPFGNYKVNDKAYNKLNFSIHDYFFAKTLDQVRPGGVIVFITSRYTMDKEYPDVRKYIAERADLLGAIRLPNNAFKANAGTEVVSDILFLQKRDHPQVIEPDWVHLGQNDDGFAINSYFIDHPEMILGRMTSENTQYGRQDFTVEPIEGLELADQLHDAIKYIRGTYTEAELPDLGEHEAIDTSIPADPNVKNYSYTVVDGDVYYRENSRMVKPNLNATAEERVKGMVELRDCVQNLIDQQLNGGTDAEIAQSQAKLNQLYDDYTAKYGLINDRANRAAFADDSSYYLLCSLEILDEEQKLKRKADMFTKRTIKQNTVVTSVDTASEALALSISEKARVDMPYMSQPTDKSAEDLASELRGVIFRIPEPAKSDGSVRYVTADEYLSGNVREKLRIAEAFAADNPDFSVNVEALRAAQPKDLDASEIEVRLGATWIDKSYIKQFMFELLDPPFYLRRKIDVNYSEFTAEWNITGKSVDSSNINSFYTYGTDRVSAYRILEDTLNLRDVRIYDTVTDADGKERRVLNAKETTLAGQKQQAIKDAFQEWIWKTPDRRHALVQKYNELFNSTRQREYNGEHITFNGMNPEISLREHQKNAVAHILYGGNTLLAHEVGAGKSATRS